jgi:hypothetical protein
MTWIRRHEATDSELSRLVRDGWSWDDVGRALAIAGIKYQTGPAISGDVLRRKAEKARTDERKRQAHDLLRRLPPQVQAPSSATKKTADIVPDSNAPESNIEDDEPEFRPASLKGWSGTKLAKKPQGLPETNPADADVTADAAEVIARLLGKT